MDYRLQQTAEEQMAFDEAESGLDANEEAEDSDAEPAAEVDAQDVPDAGGRQDEPSKAAAEEAVESPAN